MAEVQSFTLDLENRGLMVARPGDMLPPGYLQNYLNLTANLSGFIESRLGVSKVSNTNLGSAVHSQGRLIVNGTPYTYQGAAGSLFRAFNSIATGFSGNPMVMREGFPDLSISSQEIVFDSLIRMKDDGTTTTNFGIAGPQRAASAAAGSYSTKTIDLFEYATDGAIQAAWASTNVFGNVTTTTTDPAQGSYAGNMIVAASTTGYITRTVALNLGQFTTAGDSTDKDLIVIYFRVDNTANISQLRIQFDVDPSTNDFTRNYYWKSYIPNNADLASVGSQTATDSLSQSLQNPVQYIVDSSGNPVLDPNGQPIINTALAPAQLTTGVSQWLQVFIRKADFIRVGTSTNTWANVAKVRIIVDTNSNGAAAVGVDGFVMRTGNNLDATDYDWAYRYFNENTGTPSPFSPDMFDKVTISHSSATVTVANPRDTQVTHIDLYRRGGDSSIFAFSTRQVVAAWTGNTTITDSISDADLGDTALLTQVEMANLLPVPSAISTSVRKTTDNGVTYTDYTSAVGDDGSGTYADLSALDTVANGDWLVVGSDGEFRKILIVMDASVNTNASTMTVSYWNGTAWRPVLNFTDGTTAGGKTFAQGGTVLWDFPSDWASSTINAVEAFYVRISVSAVLSAAVHVTEVRLSANAFDPTVVDIHQARTWCDDAQHSNRLWYSERFTSEVFLADNFVSEPTSGDPIVRPFALDDQLFMFTQSTVHRVVGSAPESYDVIPTGAQVGLFSKYAICKGRGYIYFRGVDGIYRLPASGYADKISVLIDPLFQGIAGGTEASLQPVDGTYASTETMEFFGTKVRFGYRATNGTRYELIYDIQTERWEQTDRKPTSYLALDNVGQFYSGESDGLVYLRDTGNVDVAAAIALFFRTLYLDMGVQSQTKQFTEIVIDANLGGATLDFYADLNNGVDTAQHVSRTNATRGPLQFPLSDDTQARNIALRVDSNNGSTLVKFYKITFFYIVLPTPLTKLPTDWSDEGYTGDKRFRQLQLEIDTQSTNVSVAVQVDSVTTETLTVNTTARNMVPFSLAADTIGKLIRLIMTGTVGFRYYAHQFEFLKDPLQESRYDTYWLDFGYTRWKFIRRVWLAVNTPATVTMEIQIDLVSRYTTTFSVAAGVQWTTVELKLPDGLKGKKFRFIFTCSGTTNSAGFKVFLDQSDVEWHPYADQRSYRRAPLARSTE